MNKLLPITVVLLLLQAAAHGVSEWDALDVIDGPNPTLRYGFYTEPSGQIQMGRYYFLDDGSDLRVRLAPYGRTAIELPVRSYDRATGALVLGWEDRPERTCRLRRENAGLFLGSCIEATAVMPIAIRVANEFDRAWMGADFPITSEDVAILDTALRLLSSQASRNLHGDRNCDDDMEVARFSVFCALYAASIEVTGVYRHRRPAMHAARRELQRRFPGDYAHQLRDINNDTSIADETLVDALESARADLESSLDGAQAVE